MFKVSHINPPSGKDEPQNVPKQLGTCLERGEPNAALMCLRHMKELFQNHLSQIQAEINLPLNLKKKKRSTTMSSTVKEQQLLSKGKEKKISKQSEPPFPANKLFVC